MKEVLWRIIMSTFKLSILSPYGRIYDGDAEFITLPGYEGGIGILAYHAPMICALRRGAGKVVANGQTEYFAIGEGFVEICDNQVNVLVDTAEKVGSLEDVKHLVW